MTERLNLDYLFNAKFVSQPEFYPLEVTGRMILAAAAIESAQYGHAEDKLLQRYHHNDFSSKAEYKKMLGTADGRFEQLAVNLGQAAMIITLERGFTDQQGLIDHFVDEVIMNSSGSVHTTRVNHQTLTHEQLTHTAAVQYSVDIQTRLEEFEIILPPPSFFTQ